jgi:Asp-tRNA(Asn)/Glu-tRNA(Gln) amidotransferase B subunit
MSGKEKDLCTEMPIKGINYCSKCQEGILYWIMRSEEIIKKVTNVLSYQKFKKEGSAWIQIRSKSRRRM